MTMSRPQREEFMGKLRDRLGRFGFEALSKELDKMEHSPDALLQLSELLDLAEKAKASSE